MSEVSKGGLPTRHVSTTPMLHTSTSNEWPFLPSSTSGAIFGVPQSVFLRSPSNCNLHARPKSPIFISLALPRKKLPSLRSLWMILRWCMWRTASRVCSMYRRVSDSVRRFLRLTSSSIVLGQTSMMMTFSLSSNTSSKRTTYLLIDLWILISDCSFCLRCLVNELFIILQAQSSLVSMSVTRKHFANPPFPSSGPFCS
eukprot:08350_3